MTSLLQSIPRGDFTPIKDLEISDLPRGWQCQESLDVICHVAQRVVMIYIPRMSSERPASIYSDRPHYGGTGFAYHVDQHVVKIRTNLHVLYNLEEASTAVVQFSLHVPGKRNTRVVRLQASSSHFHTSALEDFSTFTCPTSRYLAKYLHVFHDVPVLLDEGVLSEERTLVHGDCCGQGEADEKEFQAGVKSQSAKDNETAGHISLVFDEDRVTEETPVGAGVCCEQCDAEEKDFEAGVKSQATQDNETAGTIAAVEHRVEISNADESAARQYLENRATYAGLMCLEASGKDAGNDSSFHGEEVSFHARLEVGGFFLDAAEPFPVTCNEHDQSKETCQLSETNLRGDLQTNTRTDGHLTELQMGEFKDVGQSKLGNSFEKKTSQIPDTVNLCRRPALEKGDFVAILSHPQGAEKCFSIGPAAVHDLPSLNAQQTCHHNRSSHDDLQSSRASVDLVNDRFRSCTNRVYHTHTTFGCSGAPVLLFKKSLQYLKIPVLDFSQHSGTCFFKDGGNLGFATCFTPPVFNKSDGVHSGLQQCYPLNQREQEVFESTEKRARTESEGMSVDPQFTQTVMYCNSKPGHDFGNLNVSQRSCVTSDDNLNPRVHNVPQSTIASSTDLTPGWLHLSKVSSQNLTSLEVNVQTVAEDAAQTVSAERIEETQPNICSSIADSGFGSEHFSHSDSSLTSQNARFDKSARDYTRALKSVRHHFQPATKCQDSVNVCSSTLTQHSAKCTEVLAGLSALVSQREVQQNLVKVALRSTALAHDSTDGDASSSVFSLDDGGWPALIQVSQKKSLISHTRRGVGKRRKSSSKGHSGKASKSPSSFIVRKKNTCTWKVKRSKPLSHSSLNKHLRLKSSEKSSSDYFQNDKADGDSSDIGTDKGALKQAKTSHPVAEPEPASHHENKQGKEKSQAVFMATDSGMDTTSESALTTEDVANSRQTSYTPERISDESSALGSFSKLTESSQSNVQQLGPPQAFLTEKTPSPRKCSPKINNESIYSHSEISESVSCAEINTSELEHPSQNYAEQFQSDDRGNSNVQGVQHPRSRQTKEEEGVFEYAPEHFDATLHEFFSSESRASEVFEDWSDFASTQESTSSVTENANPSIEDSSKVVALETKKTTEGTDITQTQDNQPRPMQELPETVQIYRDSDFDSLGDTLPAPRNSYTLRQLKILKNQQKKLMRKTERSTSGVMNALNSVVDQQSLSNKSYANHHGKNTKAMAGFQNAAQRFPDTVTPRGKREERRACKDQQVYRVENYCSEIEKSWLGPRSEATETQPKRKQIERERYQNHQDHASFEKMRHSEEYGRDPRSIHCDFHPLSSGESARLAADIRALHQIHQQQSHHNTQHRGSCQPQEQPWSFFSQPDNAVSSVESVQRHPQTDEYSDVCTCRDHAFNTHGSDNSRYHLNLQQRRSEGHISTGHDYFPDFPVRHTPSNLHTHFSAGFEQQDREKQRLYQHAEGGHGNQAHVAMAAQNTKQNWRSTNPLSPVDNIGCRPRQAQKSSWPPVKRTAETVEGAPCLCRTEPWPFSSSCHTTDPQAATNTDDMYVNQDASVRGSVHHSHELVPPPVKKYAFHPSLRHGHEKYPSHQCTITCQHHNVEELPEVSDNHRRGKFRDELWPPQMPAAERSLHSRDQAATTNASNAGYFQGTQVSFQANAANGLNLYQTYQGEAEQGRPVHSYDPFRQSHRPPASGQNYEVSNTARASDSFSLYQDASRFVVSAPDRRPVLREHEAAANHAESRRARDASMSTDELYCRSASQPHERYRRMTESLQPPAERSQLSKNTLYCHDPWNFCVNNSERPGMSAATTVESNTQKLRPSSRMMTTPPYALPPSHPALHRPVERRPEDLHNRDDFSDFVYARDRGTDATHPHDAFDKTRHLSRSGGHVPSLSSAFERFLCSAQDDVPYIPTDRPQWGRKTFDTGTKTTARSAQEIQFKADPIPGYHPGGEPRSFYPRDPRDTGSYRTHAINRWGRTDAVSHVEGLTLSGQQQRRGPGRSVERQHPYLQRPGAETRGDASTSTLSSTFEQFGNTTHEEKLKSSAVEAAPFHSSHYQHGFSTAYVPWSDASDDFAPVAEADMFDVNSVVRVVLEMGRVNPADMPASPRRVHQSSLETYSTQLSARHHQFQSNGCAERTEQYNEPDYVDMNNPALRYPHSSAPANNSILCSEHTYVSPMNQTIYEPTPNPKSRSAGYDPGHGVRYSSHNLLPPPLPDGRHHVSHSLGYHSLAESNHETFAAHRSSGTFAPDPNWIFTGQIPSFAQNDRTSSTTNTNRAQPGHDRQRDSRQRNHCRLSCLCANTPSTTYSPYDQPPSVFTFPDVAYADQSQQNGNSSYSYYNTTQAVSFDSFWTHSAPRNTFHNPVYQSEDVSQTPYYQNAPQACYRAPPYQPHCCEAQCCMNQQQCTQSSTSLYRQPPQLFPQPAPPPRPSQDARQSTIRNPSQDARQSTIRNPSQDARQSTIRNPSQDARQSTIRNPSQDARQSTIRNPSQDARQSTIRNPSQDARQSTIRNPSQDARQSTIRNPSQDARQSSIHNPSQDARQSSIQNPSQDARQSSIQNPSQDARQSPIRNPSRDTPPTRDPPRQEPVKSSNKTRDPPRQEPVKSSNKTRDPPRQEPVESSNKTRDPPRQEPVKSSNKTRDPPRQEPVKSSNKTRDPPRQEPVKSSYKTRDPPRQEPVKSSDVSSNSVSWKQKACVPTFDVLDTSFIATLLDLDIIHRFQSDGQSSCKGSSGVTDNESPAGARAEISDNQQGDDSAGSDESSSPKRGIYIKNAKKTKAEKSRYVSKKTRRQLNELKSRLRRSQKKMKKQASNKDSTTTNSSASSSTGECKKQSSRPRRKRKPADDSEIECSRTRHSTQQISDDSNCESANRDVCYIAVPIDIRVRLEKVSKWLTTQIFGFPRVHFLTPTDAATFRIQQNFNLTMQVMALKAGDEKAMLVG